MPPLDTARLILRPFTPEDATAIHAVYADPEVMRHVGDGPVGSVAETEGMLRAYITHQEARGFSFWAVVERETGAVIGDAGLYALESHGREIEVGYTLGRAWWGRGLATEAARACLDAAFGRFGLAEVLGIADLANPASIRVLEKLGMTPAGRRTAYGREHAVYRATAPGLLPPGVTTPGRPRRRARG